MISIKIIILSTIIGIFSVLCLMTFARFIFETNVKNGLFLCLWLLIVIGTSVFGYINISQQDISDYTVMELNKNSVESR